MAIGNLNTGNPVVKSATGNVKALDGAMLGFFCSTSSTGVIQLYDSATTTTGTPITGQITVTAGTWYTLPINFTAGLYCVLVSGSANVTFVIA